MNCVDFEKGGKISLLLLIMTSFTKQQIMGKKYVKLIIYHKIKENLSSFNSK